MFAGWHLQRLPVSIYRRRKIGYSLTALFGVKVGIKNVVFAVVTSQFALVTLLNVELAVVCGHCWMLFVVVEVRYRFRYSSLMTKIREIKPQSLAKIYPKNMQFHRSGFNKRGEFFNTFYFWKHLITERDLEDTGCPIKNASTLKGRHFFWFEYFFKRFKGEKSLNIRLS